MDETGRVNGGERLRERHREGDDFGCFQWSALGQHPVEDDAWHVVVHQNDGTFHRQRAA